MTPHLYISQLLLSLDFFTIITEIEEGAKKQPAAAPPSPPPDYAKGLNYQMPKADDHTGSEPLTTGTQH